MYGLVSKDEFDERVSQILSSRTQADVALGIADIPAGLPEAPATLTPAKTRVKASVNMGLGEQAVVVPAALAGLAFVVAVFAGDSVAGQVALGAAAECALLSPLFLAIAQIVDSRRRSRGLPVRSGGRGAG